MDLQRQLDDVKRRYLAAEAEMQDLRTRIAVEQCPLKIGEIIKISTEERDYRGTVESISFSIPILEHVTPTIGSETGWSVAGHQLKKDGEISKWAFSINSFNFELINGIWTKKDTSIYGLLGISPQTDADS